jgi:CRP-like cAMP-binding protein
MQATVHYRQRPQIPHSPSGVSALDSRATIRRFHRGESIYSNGDPASHWYRIVSGMAHSSRQFADGRRRIVDFLLPNNFFGFSVNKEHRFDAGAILDGTTVACYPRGSLEALAESDMEAGRQLRRAAMEALSRVQARILILGRVTSVAKVTGFLMELKERSCAEPDVPVILQMSRYDIADYLGLSVETVSRAISVLRRRRVISMASKREVYVVKQEDYD